MNVDSGVFLLHARVEYPVNPDIRDALRMASRSPSTSTRSSSASGASGSTPTSSSYTLRRELCYHAVSDRYVVRDVDARSGDQQHSYATLEEALEALGTVDGWPILVEPQLDGEPQYHVSVRAGVRRGRLPATLRALLFWTDDWHRESEWYSWSLPR